jgi:hypothetical protein
MAPRPPAQARTLFYTALALALSAFALITGVRAYVFGPFTDAYGFLLREIDFQACLLALALLLAAPFRPAQQAGIAVAAWCGRHPYALAALTAAALALGAQLVYHAHPLSVDEFAPYFQSRIYAHGELRGRFPPALLDWLVPGQFQGIFFKLDRVTGDIISFYWPGMALLLTPFTAAGVPWLLNPLLGAATVLVMHRIGRELFGNDEAAGLVALFTLASPAVTLNAVSFYSMPAHLLCNALFALLLLRPTAVRALAAGAIGSAALVLHNPMPHLLFALPWFAWLACDRERRRSIPALAAGYLPLCLLLGVGWTAFTRAMGSAIGPLEVAASTEPVTLAVRLLRNVLHFPTETVLEARLLGLAKLAVWAAPGLVAAALLGAWRLRPGNGPWLPLAGSALLTCLGYLFVPYDQGHGWGYRYFHSAWLTIPLFAAAAVHAGDAALAGAAPRARGYAAACAFLGLLAITPFLAVQMERFVRGHLEQLPATARGAARVVIIDTSYGFYSEDLVQNDPFLRDAVLRLASRGREADEAMMRQRFPHLRRLASDERGTVWGR